MEMNRRKTDTDPMLRDIRALMDLMPAGVRWVNRAGECEYVNQAFGDMFGYQLPEIRLLDDWFVRAYPDPGYRQEIRGWYAEKIPALARGTTPPPLQAAITCRDGSVKQVIVSAHIAMGRVIAIYADITDHARAIERELAVEAMFRLAFEGARDAIFWVSAETGVLVNCNRAAEELFGAARSEIIGRHFTVLHPPDTTEQVLSLFAAATAIPGPRHDIEAELLDRSGRRIPVLIRASMTTIEERSVVQAVFLDISERKRTETSLRRSEALYRAMVEAFDGLMYICSRDRRIEFMNRQMIERLGYDATGSTCYEALHRFESPCPWCVNERVFAGESVQWEFRSPKDGRWYHIVNNPITNAEGIASKQVTITDITARKEAEQYRVELEAERIALEEQRQFLGLVSHELRTPLSIIDGAAQLILLTAHQEPTCLAQAERIRSATRRLSELMDGCLADDRLSTSGWQPALRELDMVPLAREAIAQCRAKGDRHTFETVLEADSLRYTCDPTLMAIMLSNLLDNAVKYSPDGGTITLSLSCRKEGGIRLEFADQGIGIPPDQQEKIFNRFHRTWQIQGVPGAGLGLSLVRRIAELHGGSVACRSSVDAGSTFTVTLPPA